MTEVVGFLAHLFVTTWDAAAAGFKSGSWAVVVSDVSAGVSEIEAALVTALESTLSAGRLCVSLLTRRCYRIQSWRQQEVVDMTEAVQTTKGGSSSGAAGEGVCPDR